MSVAYDMQSAITKVIHKAIKNNPDLGSKAEKKQLANKLGAALLTNVLDQTETYRLRDISVECAQEHAKQPGSFITEEDIAKNPHKCLEKELEIVQKKREQYPASFGKSKGFNVNRHQSIAETSCDAEYEKIGGELVANTTFWKRMQKQDEEGNGADADPNTRTQTDLKPLDLVEKSAKEAVQMKEEMRVMTEKLAIFK